MTARTGNPPTVRAVQEDAALRAFDAALRRYKLAVRRRYADDALMAAEPVPYWRSRDAIRACAADLERARNDASWRSTA